MRHAKALFLALLCTFLASCAEPVRYIAVAAPEAAGPGIGILVLPAVAIVAADLNRKANGPGSPFSVMCDRTCPNWHEDFIACLPCTLLKPD